jgi:hypothetical protein
MKPTLLVLALLAVTIGAPVADARFTIQIRNCGILVERGQAGILMNDLDCGHVWGTCWTCPGAVSCTQIAPAIPCSGPSDCPDPASDKCDGGEVTPSVGVYVPPGGRLYLNGHSIRNVQFAIQGSYPDGTAVGGARIKIIGPGTVERTRQGLTAANGDVSLGVTFRDSLYGLAVSKVRAKDTVASNNTIGISAYNTIRATRVTADDNLALGFLSYEGARITYSHATGNGIADVTTEVPPRVTHTTCDHSAALVETATPGIYSATGPPYGFCSGD